MRGELREHRIAVRHHLEDHALQLGLAAEIERVRHELDAVGAFPRRVLERPDPDRQRVVGRFVDRLLAGEQVLGQDARLRERRAEEVDVEPRVRALEPEHHRVAVRRVDAVDQVEADVGQLVVGGVAHDAGGEAHVVGGERDAVRPLRVAPQMVRDRLAVGADAAVGARGHSGRELGDGPVVRVVPHEPRHRERAHVRHDELLVQVRVEPDDVFAGRIAENVRDRIGMPRLRARSRCGQQRAGDQRERGARRARVRNGTPTGSRTG